ncbi:Tn3 family transposase [Ensifer sp. ENS10]|nr:Tn3 family transposase [Ensifer sp. ENS10]
MVLKSRTGSPLSSRDAILRLVTTIRSGQVRPSTLLAKLSVFPRQNGLALALRDIGRINRSIFLPQWPDRPEADFGQLAEQTQNPPRWIDETLPANSIRARA